ncbi:aquaporin family protein [Pseudaminobacter arsenicus]|uniref:Aquaporin family protein n=1 Tax=Borborobacter arsenicus TaxID=1851146 RepID=A0A432V6B2_9HYPH|nr:MIP/aquaporin family protein [Pseudaminobacter arsenicus]RUM97714.1 aquaporin family protein [Pseudaminobacter arsenicus]
MSAPAGRILAEGLGSALLLAAIVGSGIMASKLAGGNVALALLCNALPTGAMLVVLIQIFGPVSGAHFNPVVTLALAFARRFPWRDCAPYIAAQLAGAVFGVWAAHMMFEVPLLQLSATARTGPGQWLAETIATFGLVLTIFGCISRAPASTAMAVGLYITAAFWFTASTSFANPAVTVARALTDTFTGIRLVDVMPFIIAQCVGASIGAMAAAVLWPGACLPKVGTVFGEKTCAKTKA